MGLNNCIKWKVRQIKMLARNLSLIAVTKNVVDTMVRKVSRECGEIRERRKGRRLLTARRSR